LSACYAVDPAMLMMLSCHPSSFAVAHAARLTPLFCQMPPLIRCRHPARSDVYSAADFAADDYFDSY